VNLLLILPLVVLFLGDQPPAGDAAQKAAEPGAALPPSYLSQVGLFCRDWRFWMLVIVSSGLNLP